MPGVPQCPQLPLAQVPVGSGPKTGTGNDMQEAPLPYPLLHSHKHISRSTHEGICHTGLGCTSTLSSDCSTSFVCWELRMHMRRTRTSNSGTILVVQSNFEGDGTALRKMPISKGNPYVAEGHFRGRSAHVSVRHVYAALQTPVQSTGMQKVHR